MNRINKIFQNRNEKVIPFLTAGYPSKQDTFQMVMAAEKAGIKGKPVMIYPPEEKKGLLHVLFGDIFQHASLAKLNLYPQPEYKLINQIR